MSTLCVCVCVVFACMHACVSGMSEGDKVPSHTSRKSNMCPLFSLNILNRNI